jgi:hypothetical protein
MIAYRWKIGNETHQSIEKPKGITDFEIIEVFEKTKEQEEIEQKEFELKEIKQSQYDELLKTDWYFVRLAETGQEVPAEVLAERNLIRNR